MFKPSILRLLTFLLVTASARAATIGVSTATPSTLPAGVATTVTFTAAINASSVIASSVNLLQVNSLGQSTSVGTMYDDGTHGDATAHDGVYSLQFPIFQQTPGPLTFRVSAAFPGSLTRALSTPILVSVTGVGTAISITSPAQSAYLSIGPTVVTGTVSDPNATVSVNGLPAQVSGGRFSVSIPLREGSNLITAVAQNSNGVAGTATETITLDTTPPHVTISAPVAGAVTAESSVDVSGIVNDIVVGTINSLQAGVTVNGIAAQVSNRTYEAMSVPLQFGPNTITATARDRAGNFTSVSTTITRVSTAGTASLSIVSGNGATGPIRTLLGAPLVVQARNAAGLPIPNTPVVFQVTGGDGSVTAGNPPGISAIAVNTDAQGMARVNYILGSRAGAGNNQVKVSATGITATPVFTESATSTGPALIVIDSGGNQSGVVGQALPLPFIAIVTDAGHNRLPNVQVSFTVTQGGGSLGGQTAVNATTDSDGRVQQILTLGPQNGISNNVVTVNFAGNSGLPASFTATSYIPGAPRNTTITGVVLDNSSRPIPGVTMRVYQVNHGGSGVPQEVVPPVQTNAAGFFSISPAPVGVYKLMADGTTAAAGGPFPTLEYDLVTVSGQNNTVGLPIYLQQLKPQNELCVSPTTGGTLTIPEAPGFALTVAPGSAMFPGGSRTGCISVTPVNMDKVPMVPGFGQQPRFIVTIQPVGTLFSIPAQITIPNVDGLKPRAVTEMYSYDHDLASFVAIGTGTVSADGSVIASDPGVGVLKAGWHCGGDPNANGTVADCPECKICTGNACMRDPAKEGLACARGTCVMGACQPLEYDPQTPIMDQSSIPLTHTNIGVSAAEKVIFNFTAIDQDRKRIRGTTAWTSFDGTGPYVTTFTINGSASWNSQDGGAKSIVVNNTSSPITSNNRYLYTDTNWRDGDTITVTTNTVDNASPPTAPTVGSTKDMDFPLTWTIVKRGVCPTTITTVGGQPNVFTPATAVYTYHLGPALPSPAVGPPYYKDQTILESFHAVSAYNFTMSGVQQTFKTMHPEITTPEMVVQYLWPLSIFNNGTFVINGDDRMADQHNGGAGHDDVFTPAAIAAGYGFSLPQTYSCGPNHLQDYTITHRYKNGNQTVSKTAP